MRNAKMSAGAGHKNRQVRKQVRKPKSRQREKPLSDAALRNSLKRCARELKPRAVAAALDVEVVRWILGRWAFSARDEQLPPDFHAADDNTEWGRAGRDWRVWLFMAGRGAGKTRAGAEWIRMEVEAAARRGEPLRVALVAPTLHDARAVMLEGASGLLMLDWPAHFQPRYEPSRRLVRWPDGSLAQLFSADEPDSLRGPQFHLAWCDEIVRFRAGEKLWDTLMMGLRLGERPRVLVTTTPAPVPLLKRLLKDPETWISRARTADNAANLGSGFLAAVEARYKGTRLGRQELEGEFIEDAADALFRRDLIEAARIAPEAVPPLERIVVAVDPPAGGGEQSCCGIIVAGRAADGHFHVLEDASMPRPKPLQWASAAVAAFTRHRADRIVAEVNQGGEMVEALIRQVAPDVPVRPVRATRGKAARAEPVAALYEQGRVHHAGAFPALEDQLCALEHLLSAGESPDRADALVWAITALMQPAARPRIHDLL